MAANGRESVRRRPSSFLVTRTSLLVCLVARIVEIFVCEVLKFVRSRVLEGLPVLSVLFKILVALENPKLYFCVLFRSLFFG